MATKKTKTLTEVVEKLPVKRKTKIDNRAAELIDPSGVVRGSHLTVTTFSDGTTKLDWDDVALLNEVRAAIASAELANMKPSVRAKVATRKKKESND